MSVPQDVEQLASNSGPLLEVVGVPLSKGRYLSLSFRFESGTLCLSCDDDTDELVAQVATPDLRAELLPDDALSGLIGMSIEYAWELRNHRGYADGFQIRLRADTGRTETRQFEVAAGAIDVGLVLGT